MKMRDNKIYIWDGTSLHDDWSFDRAARCREAGYWLACFDQIAKEWDFGVSSTTGWGARVLSEKLPPEFRAALLLVGVPT